MSYESDKLTLWLRAGQLTVDQVRDLVDAASAYTVSRLMEKWPPLPPGPRRSA